MYLLKLFVRACIMGLVQTGLGNRQPITLTLVAVKFLSRGPVRGFSSRLAHRLISPGNVPPKSLVCVASLTRPGSSASLPCKGKQLVSSGLFKSHEIHCDEIRWRLVTPLFCTRLSECENHARPNSKRPGPRRGVNLIGGYQ